MTHCLLAVFILLSALSVLIKSERFMTSEQKIIAYSENNPSPHTSLEYYYFASSPIHNPATRYSSVLSGYNYYASCSYQCFGLSPSGWNQTMVTIHFATNGFRAVNVRFYLVAVNLNNYFWITYRYYIPQILNQTLGPRSQTFPAPSPIPIINVSDFQIVPLFQQWCYVGDSTCKFNPAYSFHSQVNQTTILIQATLKVGAKALAFSVLIIWINKSALAVTNHPRYRGQIDVFWYSNLNHDIFDNLSPMFDIPELYYPSNSTLQPHCFIGFDYIMNSGGPYPSKGTKMGFNTTTNPITEIEAEGNYHGYSPTVGWFDPQPEELHYHIFCFDQECPPSLYFDQENQICQFCSYDCLDCIDNYCSRCELGKLVNGRCSLILGCIDFIQFHDTSQLCLTCDESQFKLDKDNGICQCLEGKIPFYGKCIPIIDGCISYDLSSDRDNPCLFCNITAGFHGPPNSGGECSCGSGYSILNRSCIDVCGDGLLTSSSNGACDDGNTDDGDGCSSVCTTEKFYRCSNESDGSPSVCVYKGLSFNLTLNQTKRIKGNNSGEFIFLISPALLNLRRMNFSKYLTLNCNSSYTITSVGFSQGKLSITVDYTEDLEGRHCTFALSYDPSIVDSLPSQLSFDVRSQTTPLVISNRLNEYQQIKFIFEILALIALGLFLIGLPTKILGVELLSCYQVSLLSLCLYEKPAFLYTSLEGLSPVTGGWSLFSGGEDSSLLPGLTDRVAISYDFLKSSGVIAGSLTVIVLLWGVLMLVKHCNCFTNEQHEQKKDSHSLEVSPEPTASRGIVLAYNWLIFPCVAGFLLVLTLSAFLTSNRFDSPDIYEEISFLGSLAMLLVFLLIGSVLVLEVSAVDPYGGSISEPSINRWYIPLFLTKTILNSILFVLGFNLLPLYFTSCSLIGLEAAYLLYILIKRPYNSALMNIGAIICQFATVFALGLPILHRFYTPSEDTDVLLLFVLQGLLLLAEALTLVRILKSFYNSVRQKCWMDQQPQKKENNKQHITKATKTKGQVQREEDISKESLHAQYLPSYKGNTGMIYADLLRSMKNRWNIDQSIQAEEDETLRRIKQNLKNDYYEKKAQRSQLMEFS